MSVSVGRATEFSISSIHIIQSHDSGDFPTGKQLHEDIENLTRPANMEVRLHNVSSARELFRVLDQIRAEASVGLRPLIHIEAHGNPSGLLLQPGKKLVSWKLIAEKLRELNRVTLNNLMLVLGTCHGFHLVSEVTIKKLTPFIALIGATDEVNAEIIMGAFGPFYQDLIQGSNVATAVKHLGEKFQVYHSERVFLNAFSGYIRQGCIGRGRQERVDRLLNEYRSQRQLILSRATRRKMRRALKTFTKPDAGAFDRFQRQFLMAGHPANLGRFKSTFSDALGLARG